MGRNKPAGISTQPVSQSVVVGKAATFSVVAYGTAPLSYQWYKNGAPIPGTNVSSYSTPATFSGDNGAKFFVVVSNAYGAVTSVMVTLTVSDAITPPPSSSVTFLDTFSNLNNWNISSWGAPGGGRFDPTYVDVATGMLRLKVTQDGSTAGSVGGEVALKQKFGYGRYDFVLRASSTAVMPTDAGSAVSGQITGAFNYLPAADYSSVTEIDSPEIEGDKPNQFSYTTWHNGARVTYNAVPFQNPEAGFHKYSFIWGAGQIQFLVDDVLVATASNPNLPTLAATPIINHWGTNSTGWGGLATAGVVRYMFVKSFSFAAT